MKYLASLIVILGAFLYVVGFENIVFFQDTKSFVLVMAFLLAYGIASHGKTFPLAVINPKKSGGFIAACLLAGVIGAIVGLVLMLQNLDDPSRLGPGMAICLISPFYALILSLLFLIIGNRDESRLKLSLPEKEIIGGSLVVLAITQTSFWILLVEIPHN